MHAMEEEVTRHRAGSCVVESVRQGRREISIAEATAVRHARQASGSQNNEIIITKLRMYGVASGDVIICSAAHGRVRQAGRQAGMAPRVSPTHDAQVRHTHTHTPGGMCVALLSTITRRTGRGHGSRWRRGKPDTPPQEEMAAGNARSRTTMSRRQGGEGEKEGSNKGC